MFRAALLARLNATRLLGVAVSLLAIGISAAWCPPASAQTARRATTWTVDSALRHLELYPDDAYAKFVALQLARREGPEEVRRVADILRPQEQFSPFGRQGRRQDVDLLSFTSGALAVQESLQLDTMTADIPGAGPAEQPRGRDAQPFNGSAEDRQRLQQLALAMHNNHDVRKRLPTSASRDANGKQLLSWRVHLLPFIEHNALFDRFHLDEPWDSPHNKSLIGEMPDIYRASSLAGASGYKTTYQVPVGEGTLFEGDRGVQFRQVLDGTSNTVMALQVDPDHAVTWTKPADVEVDFEKPFAGILAGESNWVDVAMADGSVRSLPKSMGPQVFAKLLKRDDREPVDWQAVYKSAPPREVTQQKGGIDINTLEGPTTKSHPFEEMLAGKSPRISTLANLVPEDFYFVHARSPQKLLSIASDYNSWSSELIRQAFAKGERSTLVDRLLTQLGLEADGKAIQELDSLTTDLAIVGSDLYLSEGSDVTLLVRIKEGKDARKLLNRQLASSGRKFPDAKVSQGKYGGVSYIHVTTPTRAVHAYSAYPLPDLHIRSNSLVAFKQIIDRIAVDTPERRAASLGSMAEFRYIRTLYEYGADEEDVFIYLSDPFIRRLMGPASKITELRRRQCFNHLQMIRYGTLLYITEHGSYPTGVDQLVQSKCLPKGFAANLIRCPDGGEYRLAPQGRTACCSHHACMEHMTPGCEIAVQHVTAKERDLYNAFLDEYNQYWRTFFDPIGIRIRHAPDASRVETIVLPLLDNSIYTIAAQILGGQAVSISQAPVSDRVVLSLGVTFDKQAVLKPGVSPVGPRQINNLRQIALAVLNFESANGHFPPPKGKGSQLSWRVHILPYLEEQPLYDRFRLDEPWDSPHNKELLKEMPKVYGEKGTTTAILGFADKGVFGNREEGLALRRMIDGTSNTILAVDAGSAKAVPWTKPEDLSFDVDDPLASLGTIGPEGIAAVFVDGHAEVLPADISAEQLKAYVTYAGGETIERNRPENQQQRDRVVIRVSDLQEIFLALGVSQERAEQLDIAKLLEQGIGNHISFHVYDSEPAFSFNPLRFAGQLMGGAIGMMRAEMLVYVPFINSLNAPVYVAWSLDDREVVDEFLVQLDDLLATAARSDFRGGFIPVNLDFYRVANYEHPVRCFAWDMFGFRFRAFFSRVGDHLVIATQPEVIDDLLQRPSDNQDASASPAGQVQLRIRPHHWIRIMKELQLTWSEAGREVCLRNLGPLNSAARLSAAAAAKPAAAARQAFGADYVCPCGGHYHAQKNVHGQPDSVVCSLHGDAANPKQATTVPDTSTAAEVTSTLGDLNASLTFTEHGLQAVFEIHRQAAKE